MMSDGDEDKMISELKSVGLAEDMINEMKAMMEHKHTDHDHKHCC